MCRKHTILTDISCKLAKLPTYKKYITEFFKCKKYYSDRSSIKDLTKGAYDVPLYHQQLCPFCKKPTLALDFLHP